MGQESGPLTSPEIVTTNTQPTTLLEFAIPPNGTATFHGHVLAVSGNNRRLFTAYCVFGRDASGPASVRGTGQPISPIGNAIPGISVALTASNVAIRIVVTGLATPVRWIPNIQYFIWTPDPEGS